MRKLKKIGQPTEDLKDKVEDLVEEVNEIQETVEEAYNLDELEEEVTPKPVKKKVTKKAEPKKAPAKKATPKKATAKPAARQIARLTADELKAKDSMNMSDLTDYIYTTLADAPVLTKKAVEEMVSTIFRDIVPAHMDARHPISLGDIRVGYTDVATRAYPAITALETTKNDLYTLVEAHTVARFRREIDKVSHKGRLSEDKKTFTIAAENEDGSYELTKKTIKL